ncbi:hypothetical protein Ancab_035936 [Ancistrocladus abbreviatus]
MARSFKHGACLSGCTHSNTIKNLGLSPSLGCLQFSDPKSEKFLALSSDFLGQSLVVPDHNSSAFESLKSPNNFSVQAQASFCVSKALRWWEKTLKPNMVEIHSANELVGFLKNAGDRLVIVDFYSPGCGGCRALHPKICQLAESSPDAIFLKINYEELKPICHALHIHVLPFFRFYRGAEGRLCSFSCTISTIKKFKDALAKYNTEKCSLGPAKGLEESELMKLASIGELSLDSPFPSTEEEEKIKPLVVEGIKIPNPLSRTAGLDIANRFEPKEDNAMLVA